MDGAHANFQQTTSNHYYNLIITINLNFSFTDAPGQIVSGCTPHTLAGPPPAGAGVPSGSVTLPCDPEILEWLLTEKKSACDKTINTKNKVHIIILLGGYHLLTHRKAILHC